MPSQPYLDDGAKWAIPGRWCEEPYLDDGASQPYLDDGAKSAIPGRWCEEPYLDDGAKSAIPGRWCQINHTWTMVRKTIRGRRCQVGCEVYCLSHSAHPLTLSVCLGHNRTLIGSYDLMALYKSVYYYYYYYYRSMWGGSVAEWLACWTQPQKGLG